MVFDRNKGAIYALYTRALRDKPDLQGKLVLELTIGLRRRGHGCRSGVERAQRSGARAQAGRAHQLFRFEAKDVEHDHRDQADRLLPGLSETPRHTHYAFRRTVRRPALANRAAAALIIQGNEPRLRNPAISKRSRRSRSRACWRISCTS